MTTSSNHLWRNDITGLRALAVIPVLIYHAFPNLVPGGFFGVDIFFVISGYLISGIIFRNILQGKFSFLVFYEKRIRRILPNLILCFIFCLCLGWFFLTADEYKDLAKHILASSFFVQNLNLLSEVGYFTEEALRKPLLHLWSLAIEEQFYLLFPICCLWIWKIKQSPRLIGYVVTGIVLVSLGVCCLPFDPSFRFYFPVTRFWELGAGILIAYFETFKVINFRTLPKYVRNLFSCIALGMILFSLFLSDSITKVHPGFITFIPVVGSCLFIMAWPDAIINRKVLSLKVMTFVGLISYSLYLWHWPLLSFTYIVFPNPSWTFKLLVLITAFVISSILYLTFEQPVRRSSYQIACLGICSLTCLSSFLICLISASVFYFHGIPTRDFDKEFTSLYGTIRKDGADHKWTEFHTEKGYSSHLKIHGDTFPEILFIGDSHMYAYQQKILALSNEHNTSVAFLSYGGCYVPSGYKVGGDRRQKQICKAISDELYKLLKEQKIKKLVISQMWGSYFSNNKKSMLLGIDKLNSSIENLDTVYVVLDAPWGEGNLFDPLSKINRFQLNSSDFTVKYKREGRWYEGNQLAEKSFSTKVRFIRPETYVCDSFLCNTLMYRDGHHFRNSWLLNNSIWMDQIFE